MRLDRRHLLGLIGSLGACGLNFPDMIGRAVAARRMTDSAGRAVPVPDRVGKVFPAGPPASIFLYMMAPDLMAGWTRPLRGAERAGIPEKYHDLPTTGRLTGRGGSANLETVMAMRPDLILDYGSIKPIYISLADRVQDQTGIPYALIDGRFDNIPTSFMTVGDLIGRPERGRACAAKAQAIIDELSRARAAILAASRPRVYYGRGADGLQTGLKGSINIELLSYAGAVNVAAEAGEGGLTQVSLEQVLGWDPDVVLTTDPNFFDLIWTHDVWKTLRAVKDGRVYLSPTIPWGWFDRPPSANRLIGLHWLLAVLYPDRFLADLPDRARDFYTFFYHSDLDADRLAKVLGPGSHPGNPRRG
ncbi:MAG: iron ABC transporter substrate-binding protein [Rhodospirillales bacterium]